MTTQKETRRKVIKNTLVTGAWVTPVVQSVILPAHAQTSETIPVPTPTCEIQDIECVAIPPSGSDIVVEDTPLYGIISSNPLCIGGEIRTVLIINATHEFEFIDPIPFSGEFVLGLSTSIASPGDVYNQLIYLNDVEVCNITWNIIV